MTKGKVLELARLAILFGIVAMLVQVMDRMEARYRPPLEFVGAVALTPEVVPGGILEIDYELRSRRDALARMFVVVKGASPDGGGCSWQRMHFAHEPELTRWTGRPIPLEAGRTGRARVELIVPDTLRPCPDAYLLLMVESGGSAPAKARIPIEVLLPPDVL